MEVNVYSELKALQADIAALREEVRVGFATLPSQYVPQEQIAEAQREARMAKRFAFTALIAGLSALGTYLNVIL